MSQSMYIAASGALVQQMRLEILSNNLSNLNTVGFKEDRTVFRACFPGLAANTDEDSRGSSVSGEQASTPPCVSSSIYVTFEGSKTNFSPGELKYTGNSLDFALNGHGFFCVKTSDGVQYTRKGSFALNQEGVLVTAEGLPVLGERGELRIDGRDIVVDGQGNCSVDGTLAGTIKIVDFPQPYLLEKVGDTLFVPSDSTLTGDKAEEVEVMQGVIELSNVDAIKIITEMIEVLRSYESYQKVIQSINEATAKAINEVGRLA